MVFQTAFAQDLSLSLDDIYGPESKIKFSGEDLPRLKWDSSGNHLIKSSDFENGLFEKLDLSSGAFINLVDRDIFLQSFIDLPGFGDQDAVKKTLKDAKYILSPGEDRLLIQCSEDLFLFSESILVRLTSSSAKEEVITFSPSGSQVTFVREGDLYLVDLDTQKERRLTEKPDVNTLNGYLDWVYQEEVYGRGDFKAYWWSPDSRYIAFLQLDVSDEPVHTILDNCKIYPDEEKQAYPYPGDPLAKVKLGIISVRDNQIKWMDLSRYSGKDYLVVSVDWAPGSDRVYAQVQNRTQTWLELAAYDPAGGKEFQLIRETSPAWVDRLGKPFWLTDGSFLWQSSRSGFRHIYHYSTDGELVGEITNGNFDVRALHAVSEEQGTVFFSAARDDFKDLHVYSVNLNGSGFKKVTDLPGHHRARFNKQGTMFIDTWSDINTPSRVFLNRADGSTLRTLVENRVEVLDQYRLSKPE
ncbi:MAG: DPP IV N-terminal domain-containing protein, partial [Anaerolineales bacterium]|nr:DPP IV N-terminal domain-containing protein [Anaerolineales bacterium]